MSLVKFNDQYLYAEIQQSAEASLADAHKALQQLLNKKCPSPEMTDWLEFPFSHGEALLTSIRQYQAQLTLPYDLVVVIGIGGSALGTKALYDALTPAFESLSRKPSVRKKIVTIGDHLSEEATISFLQTISDYQPLFVVVSKSGTTLEPAVAFRALLQYSLARFGQDETRARTILVTDPIKGELRKLANNQKMQAFDIPPGIGGRYSVLTAVGLVPLALAGFDVEQLLAGAQHELRSARETAKQGGDHPVLRYASARCSANKHKRAAEAMIYHEPKLSMLMEWWKQLYGESEGKEGKGILPISCLYTRDLHSLGQFLQDGAPILFETFLEVEAARPKDSTGVEMALKVPYVAMAEDQLTFVEGMGFDEINKIALKATKMAHHDGHTPSMTLTIKRLDEYHLGSLLTFFELACAVSAGLIGVDPFNQPGVEAYKKNMFQLLKK